MKVGELVVWKSKSGYEHIAVVTAVASGDVIYEISGGILENFSVKDPKVIKIRFLNLPRRFNRGWWKASQFTKYSPDEEKNAVTDWLTPPTQRFRSVLRRKNRKNRLASQNKKNRLDGRNDEKYLPRT